MTEQRDERRVGYIWLRSDGGFTLAQVMVKVRTTEVPKKEGRLARGANPAQENI